MNNQERVKEFYNNNYHYKEYTECNFIIKDIYKKEHSFKNPFDIWYVDIICYYHLFDGGYRNKELYFYEWLSNPKFKVFEVFKISNVNLMKTTRCYKQPPEIIEYLSHQIKEV